MSSCMLCSDLRESIIRLHRSHVTALQQAGYNAQEAFWLNFACIPFLPWDRKSDQLVHLGQMFDIYLDLYRTSIDAVTSEQETNFRELLCTRYYVVRQHLSELSTMVSEEGGGADIDAAQHKWVRAALIVQKTATQWREGTLLPYRLILDT